MFHIVILEVYAGRRIINYFTVLTPTFSFCFIPTREYLQNMKGTGISYDNAEFLQIEGI